MQIVPKDDPRGIVREFAPLVYRLAYARTRSRADAEDLCQDVLLRLFRKDYRFDSREHLKRWLIRATVQRSNDLFRSAWRRHVVVTDAPPEFTRPHPQETPLGAALDRLPEKYRAVVHLFYYENYATVEIAGILNRRPATVRTQLVRARELLKRELASEGRDENV